jgi:hypothetical protein
MQSKPSERAPRASAVFRSAAEGLTVSFRNRGPRRSATPARPAGFHPRVPRLCRVVLAPWHVAQIIDRRKMRRGGEVRVTDPVAGEIIPRPRQPADIGKMIAHIDLGRAHHFRHRRAAAILFAHEALVDALGHQRIGGLLEEFIVEPRHQPAHLDALRHRSRQQPPFARLQTMRLVEIFGNDPGARNRREALRDQHRRRRRGVKREKCFAPFPDPFLDQPQIEAVFAKDQANEARMRAERMMKQRVHEVLGLVRGA